MSVEMAPIVGKKVQLLFVFTIVRNLTNDSNANLILILCHKQIHSEDCRKIRTLPLVLHFVYPYNVFSFFLLFFHACHGNFRIVHCALLMTLKCQTENNQSE